MQKHANLVDLVKSFPIPFLNLLFEQIANSNEYLFGKIYVDTTENEPLKIHSIFKLWGLIFTEPPRPGGRWGAESCLSQHRS